MGGESDDDYDAIFEELENEDDSAYRDGRIKELKAAIEQRKLIDERGGTLVREFTDEKSLMGFVKTAQRCVVHFFKPEFEKCAIMDRHLLLIATHNPDTAFVKINVENCPFLVTKLQIVVLPCVMVFKDGVCEDRIIGFEKLGNTDAFETKILEKYLQRLQVL